jgi:branched-chain amino acid transport system ATP-binding protein
VIDAVDERRGPILDVRALCIRFGGIAALDDVSFAVAEGAITGLIGPNGAGKTTCFNCITRLYAPTSGEIKFKGEDLLRCAPHQVARRRVARTFQNVELFSSMTVLENVLVGFQTRFGSNAGERQGRREALDVLDYLGLAADAEVPVRSLTFSTRKMVELARALIMRPELLLLDEPAAGFGHAAVTELATTLRRIQRDYSTTIVMVEHQMRLVMNVCEHIVVLASGRKLAEGDPASIRANKNVIDAYLGAA